jgi:hypothetical protein
MEGDVVYVGIGWGGDVGRRIGSFLNGEIFVRRWI